MVLQFSWVVVFWIAFAFDIFEVWQEWVLFIHRRMSPLMLARWWLTPQSVYLVVLIKQRNYFRSAFLNYRNLFFKQMLLRVRYRDRLVGDDIAYVLNDWLWRRRWRRWFGKVVGWLAFPFLSVKLLNFDLLYFLSWYRTAVVTKVGNLLFLLTSLERSLRSVCWRFIQNTTQVFNYSLCRSFR